MNLATDTVWSFPVVCLRVACWWWGQGIFFGLREAKLGIISKVEKINFTARVTGDGSSRLGDGYDTQGRKEDEREEADRCGTDGRESQGL